MRNSKSHGSSHALWTAAASEARRRFGFIVQNSETVFSSSRKSGVALRLPPQSNYL